MTRIGMHEAKTTLSKLVERAQAGEEIVITKNGSPAVRLEPVRDVFRFDDVYGVLGDSVTIEEDFDDLPPEFLDAFSGE